MSGRHAVGTQPEDATHVDRLWEEYRYLKRVPAPTEAFYALSDALDAEEARRLTLRGRILARIRSILR